MDTLRPQITHVVGKLVINTWNRGTLFQTNLFGRFLLALLTFRDVHTLTMEVLGWVEIPQESTVTAGNPDFL